jgi:hypothetical protein
MLKYVGIRKEALITKAIKCFETVLKNLPASEQVLTDRCETQWLLQMKIV